MRKGRVLEATVPVLALLGGLALALSVGCAGEAASMDSAGGFDGERSTPPPADRPENRVVEESDIYRLDGDWLYVLNTETGLNVINVSDPREPEMAGRLLIGGNAGELYVRDSAVFILFEDLSDPCTLPDDYDIPYGIGHSELVAVDGAPNNPDEVGRLCMPGVILASRLVGDTLYVVANEQGFGNVGTTWDTWLFSYDVSDPSDVSLVDFMTIEGSCREVHVTNMAVYLAQPASADPVEGTLGTNIRYVDISDVEGTMTARGDIVVSGAPMGRFHMDEEDTTFRIVTYDAWQMASNLHVIDVSSPDELEVMSSLEGIAPGEELHATHWQEDRAYIVTWLPPPPEWEDPWIGDPLWIITVQDPTAPEILGELDLPGWSDFVFPIGDLLVGVGRGEQGEGVGMALFDISQPRNPELLRRLEFGSENAQAEANVDFRGVRIIEPGRLSEGGMIAIPWDDNFVSFHGCEEPGYFLELIDIEPTDLVRKGSVELRATGRRALPVGDRLYVIDDQDVTAIDVEDTAHPIVTDSVVVGTDAVLENQCITFGGIGESGCNVTGAAATDSRSVLGSAALAGVLLLGLALLRRRS